jgi:hypothetical protein
MIRVAAQQPFFLADYFYFQKIFLSDIFFIADFLQYSKQSAITRARLTSEYRPEYLTIPVHHSHLNLPPRINQVKMLAPQPWVEQHLKTLKSLYRQYPFFEYYFPELESIYLKKYLHLHQFLNDLICWQAGLLFPGKQLLIASKENLANLEALRNRFRTYPELQLLIHSSERDYYQKHFSEFPMVSLSRKHLPQFPAGYDPERSLLILLFLEGPETPRFFQNFGREHSTE